MLKFATGAVYDGEFQDDTFHGRGVMKCANGDAYDGEFRDDESHGRGVLTFASGDVYEGNWKAGWPDGRGSTSMSFADHGNGPMSSIIIEGQFDHMCNFTTGYYVVSPSPPTNLSARFCGQSVRERQHCFFDKHTRSFSSVEAIARDGLSWCLALQSRISSCSSASSS